MAITTNVLLCYRGHFQAYVAELARSLRTLGVRVTYDREILDGGTDFNPEAAVDWVDLGDQPQNDTTWRAPLRAAVDGAEVVVFALDIHDPSANVTNEIRWAVQSKTHTFFIIHAGPTNPESQGIVIGTLATNYMLTTGRPEYPEFGYHFCGELDRDGLEREALIASHRIMTYRARCLEGPLREISGDNDLTMADVEAHPLARARTFLQRLQRAWLDDSTPKESPGQMSPFEATRHYLDEQETQAAPLSERRLDQFRRADEILARCQPGPHELPVYLGPLVLQAACIETIVHEDLRRIRPSAMDFHPAVVIGTVPFTNLTQPWAVLEREGFSVMVFDASFVDFLYQVLKVSVSSAKPTVFDQAGHRSVQLDFMGVPEQLRMRPELLQGFHRCVRRYAAEGMPDSSTEGAPALEIQPALGTYVRLAERYLVGLDYAALARFGERWPMPQLDFKFDPDDPAPERRQALLEILALDYCARGQRFVEGAEPMRAVEAALFFHCAVHVRRQALAILSPDSVKWHAEPAAKFIERLQGLLKYVSGQMLRAGAQEALVRQTLEPVWITGTTPLQLWAQVEPWLRAERARGLKALPFWDWQFGRSSSPSLPSP